MWISKLNVPICAVLASLCEDGADSREAGAKARRGGPQPMFNNMGARSHCYSLS